MYMVPAVREAILKVGIKTIIHNFSGRKAMSGMCTTLFAVYAILNERLFRHHPQGMDYPGNIKQDTKYNVYEKIFPESFFEKYCNEWD